MVEALTTAGAVGLQGVPKTRRQAQMQVMNGIGVAHLGGNKGKLRGDSVNEILMDVLHQLEIF